MRKRGLAGLLLAVSCLAQTLELGDLVFLGADVYPETAAVRVGSGGEALVAGSAARAGLPVVGGSSRQYSPGDCGSRGIAVACRDGYVAVLEPSGAIRFATYLGGESEDWVVDAAFDSSGDVWLMLSVNSADYPVDFQLGGGGVLGLDTVLTRLERGSGMAVSSTRLPPGLRGSALGVGPSGGVFVVGHAPPGFEEVGGLGLEIGVGGAFRSGDGGDTWTIANRGLESPVFDVEAWPDGEGGSLLLGIGSNDVYISRDRAGSWRRVAAPDSWPVIAAAVAAGPMPQLLISSQGGLFLGDLAAPNWQRVLSERVEWIAPAPSDPTVVYAWGESGVSRSGDGGASFQATGWTGPALARESGGIDVDPSDANVVYLSSFNPRTLEAVLIRSSDGGQTWRQTPIEVSVNLFDPGAFNRPPMSLTLGPGPAHALYAALPGGLFRSVDDGSSWQAIDAGIPGRLPDGSLLVRDAAVGAEAIYALADFALYRSRDSGGSWRQVATGLPSEEPRFAALALDPVDVDTVYLVTGAGASGDFFVLKTDPNATEIDYLAVVGGSGSDVAGTVEIDSMGRAWVSGQTASIDFPVTDGAPAMVYAGGETDGFVAAIGPRGDELEFSTFTGGLGRDRVDAATLDEKGTLWAVRHSEVVQDGVLTVENFLGSYTPANSPEVPIALERGSATDIAVDRQGRVWTLSGLVCFSLFCRPEETFLQVHDLSGQALGTATVNDAATLAADGQGGVWVAGQGRLGITPLEPVELRRDVAYVAAFTVQEAVGGPHLGAVVQAAGFLGRPIVPGSIVSLFGEGLGPQSGSSFEIEDGVVNSAAGARVLLDETESAVLYAQAGQINAIAPSGVGSEAVTVRVETAEGSSNSFQLPGAATCPAVFHVDGTGRAAALNQDGSINSAQNPAEPESVLAVFVTGLGGYVPAIEPDQVAPLDALAVAAQSIEAFSGESPIEVEYAGTAPGLIGAVSQVNVRLLADSPTGTVVIRLEAAGCGGAGGLVEVR